MIRVGIVGFGMGGRVFHGPLISSVDGLEFAAVLERGTSNAAARYPGIKTYRSLDEMLADSSLGLLIVTTPSGTHFDVARHIIGAGRPVVVDKPMSTTSVQIAKLIQLAAAKNTLLAPFHNRRWDSDFLTIKKLLHEGSLGRLVSFESRFDRWRPNKPKDRLWKETAELGGGVLLDLGTHIADQALALFGEPESISADARSERDWATVNDAFTLRLRYPDGLLVTLGANSLSLPAGPRFHLRGTKGNYWKYGLDPQEAALNKLTRIADGPWGREPQAEWGTLHLDADGGTVTRPVEPVVGDYRFYYAGIRDALLGKGAVPVAPVDAWRVARLLESAVESSNQGREIPCDWTNEPK
ncbi:MAG TPA: Gfo/Idh/MocA family oxidoreductase [Terracidiphilus sp.]|nr:Gfo/Idh/MocA family oxidoreductase [Terracidiphilus sp.]